MAPQDTFVMDDEEETCPLCIEEFDLSDKNFRPCPCGYQICQFCWHNIKTNMNGLCPACRRAYDESAVVYKPPTQEEQAVFRANLQKTRKKRAEMQGQREVQKRESEKDARKNLVGIRVVQKNLVYVTGLHPTIKEEDLLRTLRERQFFGQYGDIKKISISHRKNQEDSLGIYVTYERKEDAQRCIQMVHGSVNGGRVLKAALGTTKYCSAWLRHEPCTNRNCMFLHELGEEEDSYTRQDLSSLNSMRANSRTGGSRSASRQQGQPPQQHQASQPMARPSSRDGSEAGDGPALPATASWARNTQQQSPRGSHAASDTASSPPVSMSLPATNDATGEAVDVSQEEAIADGVTQAPESQNPFDASLVEMLKVMKASTLTLQPRCPRDATVPPLFDPLGGAKRRAMREDEERRLNGEQDEQPTESVELLEEEPESGSHALGGEPEEHEHGHESHVFPSQRCSVAPLSSISRSSTDGLYGPAATPGFSQGPPGLASMVNRTITPQQQTYSRQNSFAEPMSAGVASSQSSLFQGQGQGSSRQPARYFSATDVQSTATNLKLANARALGQQPASFHSQPGGAYYPPSSLPGPPPGLKSTATPPNIFGQSGPFSNVGFGNKDNSELMQNMIRSRAAGAGQVHDANKREYMFSSFSPQYPPPSSSTTPVPAPAGFMAALYSHGAHQDLGAKQKKKGKKHRHANTSSSGGSGLVDLADPSILQARIQHHQQSSVGVGSGLFGGQASDVDYEFTPEATFNVDNLVSEDHDHEETSSSLDDGPLPYGTAGITSVPPGLGASTHSHPSRTATPSRAPPGLLPQQAQSTVPLFSHPVTTAPPLKPGSAPVPMSGAEAAKLSKKTSGANAGSEAKKSIKALALESGLSKEITAQSKNPTKGKKVILQEEDFPALESTKIVSRSSTPVPSKAPSIKTPMAVKRFPTETPKSIAAPSVPETPTEPSSAKSKKMKPMPLLNIAAATKMATAVRKSNPSSAVTSAVDKTDDAAFPALPTPSALASSPAARTPKTLRVVETPRTETAPVIPSIAAPTLLRQAYSGLQQRPDTPVSSENISDSASIISTSFSASRTSSPPPVARIGSAPVRTVTKSQQKKARKDATKKEAAAIVTGPAVVPDMEVGPIMGRMKKQKKDKTAQPKAAPALAENPEDSPGPAAKVSDKAGGKISDKVGDKPDHKPVDKAIEPGSKPTSEENVSVYRQAVNESISLDGALVARPRRNDSNMPTGETKPNADKPMTPADVLQELVNEHLAPPADSLALIKHISGTSHRAEQSVTGAKTSLPELKSVVTKEDQEALLAGKPVHKIVDGVNTLLTPNGNFVRNLTSAEEDRYLELQRKIATSRDDPAAYVHPRHEVVTGYNVIKGRAVANGLPSYFPQASVALNDEDALPAVNDPMQKMTREEALANINQAILTRFNLGTVNLSSLVDHNKHNSAHGDVLGTDDANPSPHQHTAQAAVSKDLLKKLGPLFAANAMQAQDAGGEVFSGLAPTMPPPPVAAKVPAVAAAAKSSSALAGITSMSLEDMEASWNIARKEAEKLEKNLNQVIKKNRRLLLSLSPSGGVGGTGH